MLCMGEGRQDTAGRRQASGSEMVEELRDRIAYLERQVEEEREARRRADTILAQLSAASAEQARTIRAIEAPASSEAPEAAQTVEEAPEEASSPRPAAGGRSDGRTAPPVVDAMQGATREARERIEKIAASGGAGDFLRGSGSEDEPGLLEVADDVPDLSEPA